MADSAFWRNLAAQFDQVQDPKEFLRAEFVRMAGFDRTLWDIKSETDDDPSISHFKELANLAGLQIGGCEAEPHKNWLALLKNKYPVHRYIYTTNADGGRSETGEILQLCRKSKDQCNIIQLAEEGKELIAQRVAKSKDEPSSIIQKQAESLSRNQLRERYFANFPGEKILVLDVCWAAREHYREWKRWLQKRSPIKDGAKPDLAFRAILNSGKRPMEYRPVERPPSWK